MDTSVLGEVLHVDITVWRNDEPTRGSALGQQQPVMSPFITVVEDEKMVPRAEITE